MNRRVVTPVDNDLCKTKGSLRKMERQQRLVKEPEDILPTVLRFHSSPLSATASTHPMAPIKKSAITALKHMFTKH